MDTQLIYAIFWFSIGVFLHHCIFLFQFSKKQEDMYSHFITNMISLSSVFLGHLQSSVDKRRSMLKEVGMSDEQIDKECKTDDQFVKQWALLYTTTVLSCIPKSVAKRLIKKGNQND